MQNLKRNGICASSVKYLILILSLNTSFAGKALKVHLQKNQKLNLAGILQKKYIRFLTTKNPYDYYIYQGQKKGIQYEMAQEFTKYLNKKYVKKNELKIAFEMIPVDFDQLIPMLNEGKGDIIAVGLTKTKKRKSLISFTLPYRKVNEVIMTRKELKNEDWRTKVFHLQKNSSYANSLSKLKKEIKIKNIDPNFNAADIMELVSMKKYDYTLVNSLWTKTAIKLFKNLHAINHKDLRKDIEISWGLRKENLKLLKELNTFLPKIKKGSFLGNIFSYKYFYNVTRIQSSGLDLTTSKISDYDPLIKKYAKKYGFDWRLLASLCYQESRFSQNIKNDWGAIGLFQIKQMTANEPYIQISNISGPKNAENNIHAGTKYLSWIKQRYFDPKKNMSEQAKIRMTLASYNAGPRRVLQAIKRAKKMGLNPNKWFRNVELAMLKLGVPEPVIYVSEINKHFVSYDLLGIK